MNRKTMNGHKNRCRKANTVGRPGRISAAAFAAALTALLVPARAYAGDINAAEQGVLAAISEKQEYQGAYYRVTDGYIAKVTEYLSRDGIDMGKREADDYIAQFYANISTGIAAGYMVKVGDVEDAGTDTGESTGSGTGTGGSAGTDAGTDAGGSAGTDAGTDAGGSAGTGTDGNAGADAGDSAETGAGTGTDGSAGTGADTGTGVNTDAADGPIVDNTTGSTAEGAVEYTVFPTDGETMYVQGIEELEVHEEAYRDSPVLGNLKEDEAVTVTGAASTGWARISYGGKEGYVSAAYLRTQGYMDTKKAEEERAAEEKRKEEEAKRAEEERKEEEAKKAEEEAAAEAAKDYSNAEPVAKSPNLGAIALGIVAVCAVIAEGILIYHKNIGRNKSRNR